MHPFTESKIFNEQILAKVQVAGKKKTNKLSLCSRKAEGKRR